MKMYPCNLQKYTFQNFSPVLCKGVLQIMQEACHVQEVRKTQHFHAPQPKQKKRNGMPFLFFLYIRPGIFSPPVKLFMELFMASSA